MKAFVVKTKRNCIARRQHRDGPHWRRDSRWDFFIAEGFLMAHLADELSVWRRSARQAWAQGFWTARMRAICAGLLIALMVWLLPGTESAGASITIILTYRVGISGLNHIIRDPPPFFSGGH